MKNLLQITALTLSLSVFSMDSIAQKSEFQAEVNAGLLNYGAGIRFFSGKKSAIHSIFSIDHSFSSYRLAALYEEHEPVRNISGLSWYAGAGLQGGFKIPAKSTNGQNGNDAVVFTPNERVDPDVAQPGKLFVGATVIFGLQYHFGDGPFSISADLKPYVNFFNKESKLFDGSVRLGFDF